MCFRKITINGTRYTAAHAEVVANKLFQRAEELDKRCEELDKRCEELGGENHKLRCANGTLKAEKARLLEELGYFSARSASPRFAKWRKNSAKEQAEAEPQVETSNGM